MSVGLYGKLPSHGDFLRRRTSDAFVEMWDGWLQECMTASRSALGDRWLDVYLTSPAWRFTAAPRACGPAPLLGLMVPSVDRVGRYFPLTIVGTLPPHVSPVAAAIAGGAFFDRAERLAIETLEAEFVDFEAFDARVAQLGDDLAHFNIRPPVELGDASAVLFEHDEAGWQIPIGAPQHLPSVFEQLFSQCLSAAYEPLMLWWTEGSAMVEPTSLVTRGLPYPQTFAALLDGSWARHHWRTVSAQVAAADAAAGGEDRPLRFRSAGATDVGRVRAANQDSFLELPESGVWVVADGLGGHSDGDMASRMVCDALADFVQTGTFDATIAAASDRIYAVNEQLVRTAERSLLGDRTGSTVAALLVRDSRCAVLWAGDSRVYRWRSGRLDQLTQDHSAGNAGDGRGDPHAITRAVGARARLDLDMCRDQVRPGDRFLLCSDGLTRVVPEPAIRAHLESADVNDTVQALLTACLDAGAPDNVTALVVEAFEDS